MVGAITERGKMKGKLSWIILKKLGRASKPLLKGTAKYFLNVGKKKINQVATAIAKKTI